MTDRSQFGKRRSPKLRKDTTPTGRRVEPCPQIQNIPVRTEEGTRVRVALRAALLEPKKEKQ